MAEVRSTSYDEVPYPSQFFGPTHPGRMAAIASLFGLSPPDPSRCRVLELGCANGGNLLPMAVELPEARFVGVDLSSRQVADGREIVEALGLGNVTLEATSLMDVDDGFGRFDYIICHGVYSWVPAEARDKILSICTRNLADDGVAYVSYNTYPGWHLRGMVRDMLNFHAAPIPDPRERIRQARAFLDFLVHSSGEADSIGVRILKNEADLLDEASDTYLFHEVLEEVNHPVYFHEFAAHAASHGLSYVGPARFSSRDVHLAPEIRGMIDRLTADRIRREQYVDFVRGRTFRQSLLCHDSAPLRDAPSAEVLERLRISSLSHPQSGTPDVRSDAVEVFVNSAKEHVTTNRPLIKAVLAALFAMWPRSTDLDGILAAVRALLEGPGPDADVSREELREVVLSCALSNLVALYVIEPQIATEPGERPAATPLARLQAGADEPVISLRHLGVKLEEFERLVLRLLDGTRDRAALVEELARQAGEGDFEIQHEGRPVDDPAAVRAFLTEATDAALRRLAGNALLVG
jgi:methyltransferase-like protein